MELRELINQTRDAMDRGEYDFAVSACSHILESYPACLNAHRMLGESLVEQGACDPAYEHFARTLTIDPLSAVAQLGLGVIAEERKDTAGAYAHYLNAWEMHPELDHLRDELVRLRESLGHDVHLHPSRSALAMIYARGGHTRRAVGEWRGIIDADPDNVPARVALAELLWRTGDDSGALTVCREVLERLPDCARALAIVTEIERRHGNAAPWEHLDHYRSLDPAGDLAADLGSTAPGRDLGFLVDGDVRVPDFGAARLHPTDPALDGARPIGEDQESMTETNAPPDTDPWEGIVREMSQDLNISHDGGGENVVPFAWSDSGRPDLPGNDDLFSALLGAGPEAEDASQISDFDILDPSSQPFSFEDDSLSMATDEPLPDGEDWLTAGEAPVPNEVPAEPSRPPENRHPFVSESGRIDLTAGWDDLDRVLREAVPGDPSLQGYDSLIDAFSAEGILPLDLKALDAEEEWKPLSAEEWEADDDELAAESLERAEAGDASAVMTPDTGAITSGPDSGVVLDELGVLDRLAKDSMFERDGDTGSTPATGDFGLSERDVALSETWAGFDNGVMASPQHSVDGYTAILRNLDAEHLGDDPVDSGRRQETDPMVSMDELGSASNDYAGASVQQPVAEDRASDAPYVQDHPASSSVLMESEHNMPSASDNEAHDAIDISRAALPSSPDRGDQWRTSPATGSNILPSRDEHGLQSDPGTSPWPRFAGGVTGLSEATSAGFRLFAHLREEKASLVELGILTVDRRLGPPEADTVAHAGPAAPPPRPLGRERLRELRAAVEGDAAALEETTRLLEEMTAGTRDASVSRLLGEAYLRLGRPSEAALLFHRALSQRGHAR
ncbi:MAG TPA: tetratricopeptide repeat protein [Thermomicrobiales bacterium]|nr:tetratricopeptide repeat protein [Thermomicrobiales bacterium]